MKGKRKTMIGGAEMYTADIKSDKQKFDTEKVLFVIALASLVIAVLFVGYVELYLLPEVEALI